MKTIAASAIALLSLSAFAADLTITIQGTATGTNLLSDIAVDTPYTLTFQTSLEDLVFIGESYGISFYSTAGSNQGGATLEIGGHTFSAPDFQLALFNNHFHPSYPQYPTVDAIEIGSVSSFSSGGLYFPSNGISVALHTTDTNLFTVGTVDEFVSAASYNPSLFASYTEFAFGGYSDPSLSGSRSGAYGTTVTSITLGSTVPEPSAFAALAGVGVLAIAAIRRRRSSV